ncbi:MAG: DoxX family protein [Bacteroidetes bacterium]|nr:DoxX family protein [Bacteroidota bacterium]
MEIKIIIFWLLILAMAAPSFIFGFVKIISKKDKVELFQRLGYPMWFMKLVGFGEIATAIGLLIEPTRLIAIILSSVILIGAVLSHVRAREPKEALAPAIVLVHLAIIFAFTFFI